MTIIEKPMELPIYQYQNGGEFVMVFKDGTKTRVVSDPELKSVQPETIDLKITGFCEAGCAYCHESSTPEGTHGDVDSILEALEDLKPGTELAIGGGNPLDHPDLVRFLQEAKKLDLICNLTINEIHLDKEPVKLYNILSQRLIYGLGVSIKPGAKAHNQLASLTRTHKNVVCHVINGVHTPDVIDNLISKLEYTKVLVLGYKTFGMGVSYQLSNDEKVKNNIQTWYQQIHKFLNNGDISVISFDNLAIEQLNMRRFFEVEKWSTFYMGDDGSHSMYIDGVDGFYAATSRTMMKESWCRYTLLEYWRGKQCGLI